MRVSLSMAHTSYPSTDLPTYTTTGGYVELRAPIDDETYEGRAVYAAAQRAAQAMADETQADVEIYAAEGYVMSVSTPAEGSGLVSRVGASVEDPAGGVWWPDHGARMEIEASDDRCAAAVHICRNSPMRGRWAQ